jgi:hypothetical protein
LQADLSRLLKRLCRRFFLFILLSGPCGASGGGCVDRFSLVGVRSAQDDLNLIPHIENLIDTVMGMGVLFMYMYLWADGSWMDGAGWPEFRGLSETLKVFRCGCSFSCLDHCYSALTNAVFAGTGVEWRMALKTR